jgi:hypothetical protein
MPGKGLVHAVRAALAERELDRGVAVLVRGLDLRDAVVGDVEHRHRQRAAVVGEDARHADLAADKSYGHTVLFWLTPRLSRWGASFNWPALHLVLRVRFY